MKDQPISRVMTPEPATVEPSYSIAAAERVMRERRCHHVPVLDDEGRIVGMISARDLLKALVVDSDEAGPLKLGTLKQLRVADVMRQKIVVLPETATLLDAAKALVNGAFHALPVVAPGGVLAGIVTSSDLIATLADAVEQPVAEKPTADLDEEEVFDEQVRLLRQVYQATIHYLKSGHGEIEHTQLLQAVTQAQERIAQPELSI